MSMLEPNVPAPHSDVSPSPADAGVVVVRDYGDTDAEVRRARAGAGLVDVSHRGAISVRGRDRVRFLQSMSTNDLAAAVPGQGVYLVFLNDKGRVVADADASVFEDEVLLDVEAAARPKLPPLFEHFIIMDDVELVDGTDARARFALHGPEAVAVAARALQTSPSALPPRADPEAGRWAHAEGPADAGGIHVWRRDRCGLPGVELVCARAGAESLWARLVTAGASPLGQDGLEVLRVEAGVPRAFVDADETTILLEAGLEHAASRSKGCYLGQEVIVRAQDRGGIRKQLRGLVLDGDTPPARGSPVSLADREVGRITSAVRSPTRGAVLALAIVHKDAWAPGTAVTVGGRPATVAPLPFVAEDR